MNKRADIPITILVIGIVALCILTVVSSLYMKSQQDKSFIGIGLIETMLSIKEEVSFYKQNPEFTTPYGDKIYFENIEITVNENEMVGTYSQQEKPIVKVTYIKS